MTGTPSDGGWQDGRADIRNALDGETGLRNDMDTKQVSLFATVFFTRENMEVGRYTFIWYMRGVLS